MSFLTRVTPFLLFALVVAIFGASLFDAEAAKVAALFSAAPR